MQTRAAVITESPGSFEVMDLELDEPRQGELLVRMVASGLCHSDDHLQTGDLPPKRMPLIGGHEGAGVVERVGPGTPGWQEGDRVVFSFIPSCGRCRWCNEGMTNLCDLGAYLQFGSRFDDLTSFRYRAADGAEVGQSCGIGSFAEHTVVSVDSAIPLPDGVSLETACILGCAVSTGLGSATNAAGVRPGDVAIVMGSGGVGIHAVQGAVLAGALTVIAVDPVELKREAATRFGATHTFADFAEAAAFARSITNGQGADQVIITVGLTQGEDIANAVRAIRKGGTVVMSGATPSSVFGIPISPYELTVMQKRIQGALYGMCNPRADIPRQIGLYLAGRLKLDEAVTARYSLDQVRQGYEDMNAGRNLRGIITY
jgi:NDMA-dependent alcohol dehydrogenase